MSKNFANIFLTDSDYSCTDKSFLYLLGFQPTLGGMVLTEKRLDIILDSRYFGKTKDINKENIRNIIGKENLEINYIESKNILDDIIKLTKKESELVIEGKIASEYAEKIINGSGKKVSILKGGYFLKNREEKNGSERQNIIKAIKIIDNVFLDILKLVKTGEIIGKTELEIKALIINKIFEFGGAGESFDSIIAFGQNSSIPHHTTGSTVIGNGPLLIDMGALYNGYCSDFTRTIWIGEKNEQYKEFIKYYKIVKESHNTAVINTKLGMTGKEIDSLSRNHINRLGAGKFFTHGLGHGVGLDVHESPKINQKSTKKIRNNMIFTIEPGIYIEGKFGIRLENIVIMENGKLKKYSKIPLKVIF